MATKRYNKEFKNLTRDELSSRKRAIEKELFDARFKSATGQLENKASIWLLRKDLARVNMLASQATHQAGSR